LRAGGVRHTVGKLSTRDTILFQNSSQSKICTQSYGAPKVVGIPTLAISKLPLWNPRTKSHLNVGLVERHKIYYKGIRGKVVASPKSGLW